MNEPLDGKRMSWFYPPDFSDSDPPCDECGEPLDEFESLQDGAHRYCIPCVRIVAPDVYREYLAEQREEPPEIVPAGEVTA